MNSQIAITLLKDLEQSLDDYCELNDEGKTAFSMAITALELFGISEQLPSVQPELSNNSKELENKNGELISRQDVIKAVTYGALSSATLFGRSDAGMTALRETVRAIKALPSVPRKGKWIDYSDEGYVECPFCHSATNCDGNKDELHYCFSCGAELRGEQE